MLDIVFKILSRATDIIRYLLQKPFIGSLGRGSYIKPGVRIVGNPYRIHIGNEFKIWHNCILSLNKGKIILGNNGLLGVGTILNAGNNIIRIGNGVAIAQHCRIIAYSHHYQEGVSVFESYKTGDIVIEDDVLIGAGVTILPSVRIGKGAIVAAGAVVNKDIEPYTIVGGIPARYIKSRI